MKYRSNARLAFPLASALAALLTSSFLHADILTWDNGAATGFWNTTDLNWTGVAAWNNATPDDAVFDAAGVGTVTLTEPISAGSISINIVGYTITGDTLTLSSGLTALTSNATSAVNSNITFATAAGTITSTAGTLTLGGTVDAGTLALTFAGAGSTTVTNGIANGTTLTKSDAGTLTLGGTNTYAGATTISGGIIRAGSITGLSPNSNITLASGTRLILGGLSNTVGALTGTGGVVENANVTPATLTIGNTGASGVYSSNLQVGRVTQTGSHRIVGCADRDEIFRDSIMGNRFKAIPIGSISGRMDGRVIGNGATSDDHIRSTCPVVVTIVPCRPKGDVVGRVIHQAVQ